MLYQNPVKVTNASPPSGCGNGARDLFTTKRILERPLNDLPQPGLGDLRHFHDFIRGDNLRGVRAGDVGDGGESEDANAQRTGGEGFRNRAHADDVSEARWFKRNEIPYRQIAFPALRRLVRRYLGGSR